MQTRSWPALGLVVLLHLLLLAWVLFAYREPTDRRPAQPALAMSRIVLSLLADKPPAPLRAQDPAPARRATSSAQRSEQSPVPPSTTVANSQGQPAPTAPAQVEAADDSARPRLNLQLPLNMRPRLDGNKAVAAVRDQALRDPRANSPRLSLEEKMAVAIGGGCFLDELLPDGSIQRRPGRWQTVKAASANTAPFSDFKSQAKVNICVKEEG